MSNSVLHQTSPKASWTSLSLENGLPPPVEELVAVVVLDVGLEVPGPLEALVVAGPRLVVELGPALEVGDRLLICSIKHPAGVLDLCRAHRLGSVAVVLLEPDVAVDQLGEAADRRGRRPRACCFAVGVVAEPVSEVLVDLRAQLVVRHGRRELARTCESCRCWLIHVSSRVSMSSGRQQDEVVAEPRQVVRLGRPRLRVVVEHRARRPRTCRSAPSAMCSRANACVYSQR